MVNVRTVSLAAALVFGALFCAAPAVAFCDTLTYAASGLSEQDALTKANNRGLVEVRQLNQRYGSRIAYEPAKSICSGASHVRCTITQRYCVANAPVKRDTCPGDSVRNKQGQCVKEDEPVLAHPCSGGRLYSLSRKICHCPDALPVWTGQRCISSKPVSGPSNSEIIQRCRVLDQQCKSGLQGACRALPAYCDRG